MYFTYPHQWTRTAAWTFTGLDPQPPSSPSTAYWLPLQTGSLFRPGPSSDRPRSGPGPVPVRGRSGPGVCGRSVVLNSGRLNCLPPTPSRRRGPPGGDQLDSSVMAHVRVEHETRPVSHKVEDFRLVLWRHLWRQAVLHQEIKLKCGHRPTAGWWKLSSASGSSPLLLIRGPKAPSPLCSLIRGWIVT